MTEQNIIANIKTDLLIPPTIVLRNVYESSIEFYELMDSVREYGILNSILVRKHPNKNGYYEIIDGMWRFSVCKILDIGEIPCIIKVGVEDEDILVLQIQANAISYETKPIEFAEQMQKMILLREEAGIPTTLTDLGKIIKKSPKWVSDRLQLLKLCYEAKFKIRQGSLPLSKAVILSRLKNHDEQRKFLRLAKKYTRREFELIVGKRVNEILTEAGELRANNRYTIRPIIQTMDSLLIELDRLSNVSQIIVQENAETPLDGAKCALKWALNLHDESINKKVREVRRLLSDKERFEILGKYRSQELEELRQLRLNRNIKIKKIK